MSVLTTGVRKYVIDIVEGHRLKSHCGNQNMSKATQIKGDQFPMPVILQACLRGHLYSPSSSPSF
jgi:hypothetical protein